MRTLIVEEWLSLDGYAEDANGKLDFFPTTESNRHADRDQLAFLDGVDAILLGRKTYELFVDYWPTVGSDKEIIADRLNAIPKLVFSNTLEAAPWGTWAPAQIVRGDPAAEVRRLKAAEGRQMVLWGSLTLARSLAAAGLVDEYRLHVAPTMTGGGRRLFAERDGYTRLRRTDVRSYENGLVALQYEPLREGKLLPPAAAPAAHPRRPTMPTKPTTTEEYLATLSDDQRSTIERLQAAVRQAAPGAEEIFSYGMPGFRLGGRPLVWVAAWRRHYSLYPISVEQVAAMAAPDDVYEAEKGTVRFPATAALPFDLVTRLVQARADEISAGAR